MLILSDSRSRCRLIFYVTFIVIGIQSQPMSAQDLPQMPQLMEEGLMQYAKLAGQVAGCDFAEQNNRIDELAQDIAAWRYPSWWSWLTGARGSYASTISERAHSTFTSASIGCEGAMTAGLYKTLRDDVADQITSTLRTSAPE
jgi:hypothetical protein